MKYVYIITLIFYIQFNGFGQGSAEASKNNIQQNIPVSQYTGSAGVNIPIYTFQEGIISVPITLTNTLSGVRVGEEASWCGLGWNLDAGGLISRIVKGLPDEGSFEGNDFRLGYYQGGYNQNNVHDDHEPDIFIINLGGSTYKFMFDNDRNIQVIPKADIKIEPFISVSRFSNQMRRFGGFKVTTADGTSYYFGRGTNINEDIENGIYEYSMNLTSGFPNPNSLTDAQKKAVVVNAWYLVKIVSPMGQEVTFKYSYNTYLNEQPGESWKNNGGGVIQCMDIFFKRVPIPYSIEGKNSMVKFFREEESLCPISFDVETGYMNFGLCATDVAYFERKDLLAWEQNGNTPTFAKTRILKDIVVFSKENSTWKKQLSYNLGYGYFEAENIRTTVNQLNTTSGFLAISNGRKLKLNNIIFPDGSNYSFEYYIPVTADKLLGDLWLNARDHWGFYNGIEQAGNIIGNGECQGSLLDGNRTTSVNLSKVFSLYKMTSSLGTETIFEYQTHDAWNYGSPIGGNRVSKIITKDLISDINSVITYDYKQFGTNTSSGFLIMKPVYRYSYNTANSADFGYNTVLYSLALSASGRPTVSYKNVTETHYSIKGDVNNAENDTYKVNTVRYTFNQNETEVNVCNDTEGYSYKPYKYKPNYDYSSGSLNKVEEFAKNGTKASETSYEYFTNNLGFIYGVNIAIFNNRKDCTYPSNPSNDRYVIDVSFSGLRKQTTKTYDFSGNNYIQSSVEYKYKNDMPSSYWNSYPGKHFQVVKTSTSDSKGNAVETYNKYVADFEFGTHQENQPQCYLQYDEDARDWGEVCNDNYVDVQNIPTNSDMKAIHDMKEKYMVASPVESYIKRNGKIISATYNTYYPSTGLLNSNYSLKYFPLATFTEAKWSGSTTNLSGAMTIDTSYILSNTINTYSVYGFPTESKVNFGAKTTMTYQTNNLLPYQTTNASGTPEAQTSTVTFDSPLFGVSKQTAPNGVFTTNVYEVGTGRLIKVTDRSGNIIKHIEYKPKGQ